MSNQDTPQTAVGSGPTPAYPVNRTATIPAVWVDAQGQTHGDDWPLNTTQTVRGTASDGSTVTIGSTSTQAGPNQAPRVTGSSISIEQGNVRYSVDLNPDGSIQGTGGAANIRMNPTEVANLAQYFDNITDPDLVSGATLDAAVARFRQAASIERK